MTRRKIFLRDMKRRLFWLLSFRKRQWELHDYPIDEIDQGPDIVADSRYRVDLIGWAGLCGLGPTRDAAMADLREKFELRRKEQSPQLRPGLSLPIKFASTEKVDRNGALLDDLIQHVLELPWAFISDESSLWDFGSDETVEKLYLKIASRYGVDVRDVPKANLADILEKIHRELRTRSGNIIH